MRVLVPDLVTVTARKRTENVKLLTLSVGFFRKGDGGQEQEDADAKLRLLVSKFGHKQRVLSHITRHTLQWLVGRARLS